MDFENGISLATKGNVDEGFDRNRDILISGQVLEERDLLEEVEPLSHDRLNEIAVWAEVLKSLKDGLPLPNNPLINVKRIEREEVKSGNDYSELKKCCAGNNEVRDSHAIKPFFFAVIDRIQDVSNVRPKAYA